MTNNTLVSDDISEEAVIAVIEVLLLAIIRAYPTANGHLDNYKRLNAAKLALFNLKSPQGRPEDDDTRELIHMANAYIKARGQPTIGKNYELSWPDKPKSSFQSETKLACRALRARKRYERDYRPHNVGEKVRNLQQKFHRNMEELLKIANGRTSINKSAFNMKLNELNELLTPLGLRMVYPKEPVQGVKAPI
jgi:hypothetical protein